MERTARLEAGESHSQRGRPRTVPHQRLHASPRSATFPRAKSSTCCCTPPRSACSRWIGCCSARNAAAWSRASAASRACTTIITAHSARSAMTRRSTNTSRSPSPSARTSGDRPSSSRVNSPPGTTSSRPRTRRTACCRTARRWWTPRRASRGWSAICRRARRPRSSSKPRKASIIGASPQGKAAFWSAWPAHAATAPQTIPIPYGETVRAHAMHQAAPGKINFTLHNPTAERGMVVIAVRAAGLRH